MPLPYSMMTGLRGLRGQWGGGDRVNGGHKGAKKQKKVRTKAELNQKQIKKTEK